MSPDPGLDPDIRLTLPARPENIAVVRHVLDALAEALALPEAVMADVRLAVTEACTNVVRHAYTDGRGAIDVVAAPARRCARGHRRRQRDAGSGRARTRAAPASACR